LTRGITISALGCFLVAGAACASILSRSSMPDAGSQPAAASITEKVVTNRQAKADKLKVVRLAMASLEPSQPAATATASTEPLQSFAMPPTAPSQSTEPSQAYASAAPNDVIDVPHEVSAPAVSESPKPKVVERPAPAKPYALLSDAQIAGIKERLKLSPDQEYYWPAVESALRAVARKIHSSRQADAHTTAAPPIDPDSAEVQQLKSAAMPLLFQLREDQKNEVRTLARLIGLERVAAQI
jgi:hypothetical protein